MKVTLKPGKETPIKRGHPWIFSGAIAQVPHFEDGDVLPLHSASGEFLGQAYFNRKTSIMGRMISSSSDPLNSILEEKVRTASALRASLFSPNTNAFRLINAEGDGLPGLIADYYNGVLVVQVSTLGMRKMLPLLLPLMRQYLPVRAIFEKSSSASLKLEGLEPRVEWLFGTPEPSVNILEEGIQFQVDIEKGQKTGFFLDQREMRKLIGELAQGKKMLNTFAYSGGFSLYALRGGASHVTSVDISESACALIDHNVSLNQFSGHRTICADAFDFLREDREQFDLIILDPPAFAKRKQDEKKAFKGYKEINIQALKKLAPGGILLSSSCSYFFDEGLFRRMMCEAAFDARTSLRLLGSHRYTPDHPSALAHPEGQYLKSLVVTKLD